MTTKIHVHLKAKQRPKTARWERSQIRWAPRSLLTPFPAAPSQKSLFVDFCAAPAVPQPRTECLPSLPKLCGACRKGELWTQLNLGLTWHFHLVLIKVSFFFFFLWLWECWHNCSKKGFFFSLYLFTRFYSWNSPNLWRATCEPLIWRREKAPLVNHGENIP